MASTNVEEVLKYISKNYVSLDDEEVKDSNRLLATVLDEITRAMKEVSPLFSEMFETYSYSGSSYEGSKINKPDEFDINLKMKLPKILSIEVIPSNESGFVHIYLKDWDRLQKDKFLYHLHSDLQNLKDAENYLSQSKIKQWMQKIVTKARNKIIENGTLNNIKLKYKMSGPAITLSVVHNNCLSMNIDLVAAFRLPGEKWPTYPYRKNPDRSQPDYMVVAKAPKIMNSENIDRYWRLGFPDQEKNILSGYSFCKPALRLLKKMRDTQNHNIPSYFLKTIFIWEIEKRHNSAFWNSSLKNVFLEMLAVYRDYLKRKTIPYYWNENNNLISYCSDINIENIKNYLNAVIKKINSITDPVLIAKFILPPSEYQEVRNQFEVIRHSDNLIARHISQFPSSSSNENSNQTLQEQDENNGGYLLAGVAALGIGLAGLYAYNRYRRDNN